MTYSNNIKQPLEWGMVLAAGFGKRLQPLTLTTPKPLVEVGGNTLLDHSINHLRDVGIKKIVVNTHYLHEKVENHLKKYKDTDIEIFISYEPEILETGGGVLKAIKERNIKEIIVLSSDIYIEKFANKPILQPLLELAKKVDFEGIFFLKNKDLTSQKNVSDFSISPDHKLYKEKNSPYIFVGAYILKDNYFKNYQEVKPFRIPDPLFPVTKENCKDYKYYALELENYWCDIGNLERLEDLRKRLSEK